MQKLKTGDVVTLQPISKDAKDQSTPQDAKWIVEAITEKMLFENKTGIWLGLRAESGHSNGFRWVHLTDDEHFKVIH